MREAKIPYVTYFLPLQKMSKFPGYSITFKKKAMNTMTYQQYGVILATTLKIEEKVLSD